MTPRNMSAKKSMTMEADSLGYSSKAPQDQGKHIPSITFCLIFIILGVEFLQNQLKTMTTEKRRLEEEYARLPIVIQKSPALQRRKEYLEKQLTLVEKSIDSYTVRLRETKSGI